MQIKMREGGATPRAPEGFADTRWSLVAALGAGAGTAARSLAELCRSYWYPVYAYVRRCGHPPELAYDLAQAFFGHLLAELKSTNPQQYGQFRRFLLARLNRFLAEDWRNERLATPTEEIASPLPLAELELRQRREHAPEATPERAFHRSFALEVLARSLQRLRLEAQQGGRLEMFERLEPFLTGEPGPGQYEVLAEALNTRALAVVVAIKRLRQRFRELVDEELAETVASGGDMDAERGALLAILGDTREGR